MNQIPPRTAYLLEQYLLKTASGPEVDELFSTISENDLVELLSLTDAESLDRERWAPVLESIFKNEKAESKVVRMPLWKRLRWIAAAIAVLLVIGLGDLFLIHKTNPEIAVTTPKNQGTDLLPGGNKAVLTLGNGSKIILDTAANGTLAKQGNSNIIKTDSGSLSYQNVNEKQTAIVYNTLSTPRGGQYQLTLPDGTKTWLNAASSITYPTSFSGNERVVEVTGEVYFEVVHNAHIPFRVKAGDQTIEDIGTSFNINAYLDEPTAKTTLIEGSVKVSLHKQSKILVPGEQIQIIGKQLNVLPDINTDEVLAWKNGFFSFHQTDLPAVMRQLARWYNVDVKYEGPIPTMKFGGEINRNSNASQVLKILEESKVHFILKEHTITVTP